MTSSPLVFFHIWAGTIGLISGAAALSLGKGSRLHRMAGNVFFVSMLTMSGLGAYRGFVMEQTSNVIAGSFTFYLVATAWLTVMRKPLDTGRAEIAAMLVAAAVGSTSVWLGWEAATSASGMKLGYPAAPYFVFGFIALFCAGMDARMLKQGGVAGAPRLLRHLGRMCLAMFIATASLFLGQQQMFPEAIRQSHLLGVPVLAVVAAAVFWQLRVRFAKAYRARSGTGGAGAAAFGGVSELKAE